MPRSLTLMDILLFSFSAAVLASHPAVPGYSHDDVCDIQHRCFFSLPKLPGPFPSNNKRKDYSERRILGY